MFKQVESCFVACSSDFLKFDFLLEFLQTILFLFYFIFSNEIIIFSNEFIIIIFMIEFQYVDQLWFCFFITGDLVGNRERPPGYFEGWDT